MPSSHKLPLAGYQALNFRRVKDPGDGNTFTFHSKDSVYTELTSGASAETRVLPSAGGYRNTTRFRAIFVDDGGGAITITGADNSPVLTDVHDTVEFIITEDQSTTPPTKAWRVNSDSRFDFEASANLARTVQLDFTQFRLHTGLQTLLGGTPAVDDIGLVATAFGTAAVLQSLTADEADDDNFARILWAVPADYVAGTDITVTSVVAEVEVAGASADLDLEARRTSDISTELQGSAATSVLGGATVVQTITGTNIVAGEVLDLRFNLDIDNTAGPGTVHYNISSITIGYTGADRTVA